MRHLIEEESGEELDDRADLVPLIDCVFLVLLFYVVVATFAEESIFPVELPRIDEASQNVAVVDADKSLTLWIASDGAMALGDAKTQVQKLAPELKAQLDARKPEVLVIRGDRRAPYEIIAAAVETSQSLGVSKLSLVVESGLE